jgi:hypothetical protein
MSSHSVAMKDHFFYLRHKLPLSYLALYRVLATVGQLYPTYVYVQSQKHPGTAWTLGGSGPERAGALSRPPLRSYHTLPQ